MSRSSSVNGRRPAPASMKSTTSHSRSSSSLTFQAEHRMGREKSSSERPRATFETCSHSSRSASSGSTGDRPLPTTSGRGKASGVSSPLVHSPELFRCPHHGVGEDVEPLVELLVGDDERHQMAHHIVVGAARHGDDSALHGLADQCIHQPLVRLLVLAVLDEFDSHHGPHSPNLADLWYILGHLVPASPEGLAD